MNKTILLFGFEDLPSVVAVRDAAFPLGAEIRPVGRSDWGRTLGDLLGLDSGPAETPPVPPGTVGRMLVLSGLERDLDALLPALQRAGILCPKAILTPHNRGWTAVRLYRELTLEQQALERRRKG